MPKNISRLEEYLDMLARFVSERMDGERYVPLYERVEAELEKMRRSQSTFDRIRLRHSGSVA